MKTAGIIGGTEPPLILRDASEVGIPLLDTTKIHVKEIVREMTAYLFKASRTISVSSAMW